MIIDGPLTFDLTQGVERRIPQDGDAQTFVPAMVQPVALMIQPTVFINGGNPQIKTSHYMDQAVAVPPSTAAADSNLLILTPGLWELELALFTQFNYLSAVGTLNGASIIMIDSIGRRISVLLRIASIGTFTDYNRCRILVKSNVQIVLAMAVTAVAQNADARASINCIKVL